MTDDELAAIRERVEAAEVSSSAWARTYSSDVPVLLAEVERLRGLAGVPVPAPRPTRP